jgi:hypothetical protein
MKNVRWFFVSAKDLLRYLAARPAERGVRYVTGIPRGKLYPANGPRAIAAARRVGQIAAGSLRVENGLVS